MKNLVISAFMLLTVSTTVLAIGDYELQVMIDEMCTDYGNKAATAFKAKQSGIPKKKVLDRYAKDLALGGRDEMLTRQVVDFGFNEATSIRQAGMRGWAMCKDILAENK